MRVGKEKEKLMRTDRFLTAIEKKIQEEEKFDVYRRESVEISIRDIKCEVPMETSRNMFNKRFKHPSLVGRNFG